MKKKVLSLLFACIMILSVLAISGCKSDELQAQIDENATKAETAVTDAAAKAETDLAAAKAELEALIAAGDAADAKDLADAVAKLNSAIDAAKAAATTADDALKADLTAAIATAKKEAADGASAALDAAVKKLNDAVALKVDATAYNKAVADLEAAVAAAKKTASDADAALETKLTTAIATAKAEAIADAKTYVDAKVAELKDADKTSTDAFNKAIADVNAAIDAAEKLAADADAALKTSIDEAKATAVTEAKAYVDAQIAEFKNTLDTQDETDKAALALEIQTLKDNIAAAEAAAKKAATDADAVLADKIAELEAAIAYGDKATADAWGDWNDATAVVIEKLAALRKAENKFMTTYNSVLPQTMIDKAIDLVAETEAKLLRAVNKAAAEDVYSYAGDFFATVDGVFEVYNSYNKAYYYDAELKALADLFAESLKALEATTAESDVPAIKTALKADMDKVMTKDKALLNMLEADGTPVKAVTLGEKWTKLLAFVNEKINTEDEEIYKALNFDAVKATYDEYQLRYNVLVELKAAADLYNLEFKKLADLLSEDNKYNATFNKDNVELYKLFEEKVAVWYENLGETNEENKTKLLDATILEEMRANFNARRKGLEDYAAKMLSDLERFGAKDYKYLYDATLEEEVFALHDNYIAFKQYVVEIGYELGEEYHVAFNAFEAGTYARAFALNQANIDATAIEDRIQTLTGYLTHLTSFKSAYQLEMEAILADVETWKSVYFDNFAAEKVEGNDNWELLDHAALAALEKTYHDKLDPINAAIKNLADEFKKPGFVTVNLLSGDDITNARNAWDALVVLIADLGLGVDDIEDVGEIPGIKGVATTDKIADLFDAKTIEYANKKATAAADYAGLKILSEKEVTIYDEAIVKAMAKWYFDYLGMNIADAASVLPDDGKNLKLSDTLTITDELFAAAKATYAAWALLTEAKINEMNALNGDIAAFLAKPIYTESKAEFCALKDRYMAFMTGEGAKALGFGTEQYAITADAPYAVDVDEFLKAGDKITALEEELKWIFVQIDAFADKEFIKNNLLDATLADKNIARLGEVESYMISFTEKNAGFNCFVESAGTEYKNRELVIAQSRAFIEIAETYASAMANVTKIGTDAVEADLTKRAGDARDAAVELILTLEPAVWATDDAFAAEMAKLNVVEQTIDAYLTYVGEKTEVLMAERYENHVKTLMNTVTAEKVASYEKVNETAEDLVEDVMYSIKDTFAKIGSNN